jgi:hypothetical protein
MCVMEKIIACQISYLPLRVLSKITSHFLQDILLLMETQQTV